MMKIDIERLIDAVAAENEAYKEYCYKSKNLYKGDFDELADRKKYIEYCRQVLDREQNAVASIIEVFMLDSEARTRLYIAARAVNRWRIATNWESLIPEVMQWQVCRFVFGSPSALDSTCERCGCWEV